MSIQLSMNIEQERKKFMMPVKVYGNILVGRFFLNIFWLWRLDG